MRIEFDLGFGDVDFGKGLGLKESYGDGLYGEYGEEEKGEELRGPCDCLKGDLSEVYPGVRGRLFN